MSPVEKGTRFIEDADLAWEEVAEGVTRKIMAFNDDLMVVKVKFETGSIGTLHQHYHSQISHVQGGVFEVEIGGEKKMLKDGDAFYASPNVVHGVVCMEAGMLVDVFNPMREDFLK